MVDHSLKEKKINNKEYLRYAMLHKRRLCADLSLKCVRASAELDARRLVNMHELIVRLKSVKRQGWIEHQLEGVESVADHTFMVCILAYVLAPHAGCDRSKSVILSLLHDLPESIVGDITPNDSRLQQKRMMEAAAMKEIASLVGDSSIYELWREVELGTTPEGKLVKDLDRLEAAMQSMVYEDKFDNVDLSEFRLRANAKLNTPLVQRLLEEIVYIRQRQDLG
jgi:putative hydrolase of HD superfamily